MEISISLLPVTAGICILISIIEGWLLAFMKYIKLPVLQKIFPGYKYLVRSHVDYLIMAALLFSIFYILTTLDVQVSKPAIAALVVGAVYNPAGFIAQALKPDIAEGKSLLTKSSIIIGFLPATYGFGAVCLAILNKYL